MLIEALDQAYDKIRRLEAQKNKREEEDADEDSVDKLKIIEKEEEEDDVNECEEEDDVKECEEENIKHHDEDKEEEEEGRKEGRQKAITGLLWVKEVDGFYCILPFLLNID